MNDGSQPKAASESSKRRAKKGGEALYEKYKFVRKSISLSAVFRERFSYFFHTAETKMPTC
jgi:hypothetical protein